MPCLIRVLRQLRARVKRGFWMIKSDFEFDTINIAKTMAFYHQNKMMFSDIILRAKMSENPIPYRKLG